MDDRKFGDILAERRRALRKSVDQVSQATGLNHAAITAFESSNFAAMPAGYAQNMITTYSRYLGLDPSEMARLYHRQYERFEKNQDFKKAARRTSARLDDETFDGGSRRRSARSTQLEPRTSVFIDKAPTRKMNIDDDDYRSYRDSLSRPRSSRNYFDYDPVESRARQRQALEERDDEGTRYEYADRKARRSNRSERQRSSSSQRTSSRKGSRTKASARGFAALSSNDKKRLAIIGGVLLLLLAVLIALALVVRSWMNSSATPSDTGSVTQVQNEIAQRNNPTPAPSSQPSTPNTGAQQGASGSASSQGGANQPQPPTKTVVAYTVEPGKSTWIEVSIDGKNVFAGTAASKETKSFDVTGELEMTVSDPSAVKVTKNGEAVTLKESNGIATLHVKFADDLAAFKKKYPDAGAATGAGGAASSQSGSHE